MQIISSGFKYRHVVLISCLISGFSVFAQKDPLARVRSYIRSGDTLHLSSALEKINSGFAGYNDPGNKELMLQAEKKATAENSPLLTQIYSLLRQFYISDGNRPKTLEYSLKQYQSISRQGNNEQLLWILIDIGNMFYDEAEYAQALDFYRKAENIAQKYKQEQALPVIYLNFGLVYNEKKDYSNALKYLHKSSGYRIREENVRTASSTFVRIAEVHKELGQADSAYKYTRLAEEYYYYRKGSDDNLTDIPMHIYLAWFNYYKLTENHEQAIFHFNKAQEYALQHHMIYEYYHNISYEAKYYSDRGDYRTAIARLKQAIPFFRKHHLPQEERYFCKAIGNNYSSLNDQVNANTYFRRYIALDDSIRKSDLRRELDMMRTIAAVYESDVNLERTKKKLQIEKINAAVHIRERNTSVWIAALSVAGVLVLLGQFINLRKRGKELLSLHRKLKDQHQEIKISALELERTNKIKDKLFSIIAHDLRNPLNRLMAELSIARKRFNESHFLDPMEITLKETINLFEGLLQWSKLDNTHSIYSPSKVNIGENINNIISFYLPEIQSKNICVINNSNAISAFADRNILQTLLRNILSNAITSISNVSDSGTIEIESEPIENDNIRILFHDSGAGFPQDIIDGFISSDNITNGKGLGLSICKMLARMSGWQMEISNDSKLGGALIVLVLPCYKDEAPQEVDLPPLTTIWKDRLSPVKQFKFYQTSEIRKFIKSFSNPRNTAAAAWLSELEACIHEGDEAHFSELVKKIEDL